MHIKHRHFYGRKADEVKGALLFIGMLIFLVVLLAGSGALSFGLDGSALMTCHEYGESFTCYLGS